ncbi:MAG: hypothetical protein IPH75_14845 [bacterium]|nr:hypothetical protein [bacterium]
MKFMKQDSPSLPRFKIVMAIVDNIRNMLLLCSHAAFSIERNVRDSSYHVTSRLFTNLVVPHTALNYNFLLNPDVGWRGMLSSYIRFVDTAVLELEEVASELRKMPSRALRQKRLLRKWRECDHFLENIAAVQLGLHELKILEDSSIAGSTIAMGITYGGIEMPAIARAVAKAHHVDLRIGLAHVSIYSTKEVRKLIQSGKWGVVQERLLKNAPVVVFDDRGTSLNMKKEADIA